jgi:hypothetical protein
MRIIVDVLSGMRAFSVPSAVLAGSMGFALILLVAWIGLLYFKVLRLSGKDQVHGLNVLKELTNLIKAASAPAKSGSKPDDE